MNKEESLALFAQGRDAWNAWAATMFAEREALEAAGTWTVGRDEAEWNDATRTWHEAAEVDFLNRIFKGCVNFSGFVFPGDVSFVGATFSGNSDFDGARFSGGASFIQATFSVSVFVRGATFSGDALFSEVTFAGSTWFDKTGFLDRASFHKAAFSDSASFQGATFSRAVEFFEATFSGSTWFGGASFLDSAGFEESAFETFTSFEGSCFRGGADFSGIKVKSAFSLADATFLAVPDFIQAHFAEAPRLDNSRIQPQRFQWPTLADVKNYFKGDPDLSARWRALKRLAVQGHDHMHELEFFKNEMKTRRWSTDRPWHAVFWFGLFYGWISDFGRSIVRPVVWWTASAYVFALLYLGAAVAPPLQCLAGSGDPWQAALWISVRKALLFFGLDSSDKLTEYYACLYGVIPPAASGQLPASFRLDVPDIVIILGIAQHIISAVLLFLLLLAIRNHFRIK